MLAVRIAEEVVPTASLGFEVGFLLSEVQLNHIRWVYPIARAQWMMVRLADISKLVIISCSLKALRALQVIQMAFEGWKTLVSTENRRVPRGDAMRRRETDPRDPVVPSQVR